MIVKLRLICGFPMHIFIMEIISNLFISYLKQLKFRKAISIYDELMKKPDYNKELHVYKACCLYALINYDEAKRECLKSIKKKI